MHAEPVDSRAVTPIERFPLWASHLSQPFMGQKARRIATRTPVAFQGDPIDEVHWIQSGCVRAYHTYADGRRIVLGYWTPGMIIGLPGFSRSGDAYLWSSEAKEDTTLITISRRRFREWIERSAQTQKELIGLMEMKISMLSHLAQMLAESSATVRLGLALQRLAHSHGVRRAGAIHVNLRLTHSDLAEMIGASRQWTTTKLLALKRDGAIDISGKRVVIRRLDGLNIGETFDGDAGALRRGRFSS
jgi:CRP-like cAMP-binding protein